MATTYATITLALLNKTTAKPMKTLDINLDDFPTESHLEKHIEEWVDAIRDEKIACDEADLIVELDAIQQKARRYADIDFKTIALVQHENLHENQWISTKTYIPTTENAPEVRIHLFDAAAYYEYTHAIDADMVAQDAIDAALDMGLSVTEAIENYLGEYCSDADFAYEMHKESGTELGELANHIDWDSVANDMQKGGEFTENDGHYFSS